jgi:hypothetical protein
MHSYESPLTPLWKRGEKRISPFEKWGLRGILKLIVTIINAFAIVVFGQRVKRMERMNMVRQTHPQVRLIRFIRSPLFRR